MPKFLRIEPSEDIFFHDEANDQDILINLDRVDQINFYCRFGKIDYDEGERYIELYDDAGKGRKKCFVIEIDGREIAFLDEDEYKRMRARIFDCTI